MIEAHDHLTDLIGDRNVRADLACFGDRKFDACIDTCAYFPAQVDLLASTIETRHYSLVSSVYGYIDRDGLLAEDSPLEDTPVEPGATLTPQNYGALKVQCEKRAAHHFHDECLIIRPSIIIGPGDHTERMSFWMRMVTRHHKRIEVVGVDPTVQFLDVRDLAKFVATSAETSRQGPVNVCGTEVGFREVLDGIERISAAKCDRRTVSPDALPQLGLSGLPYLDTERKGRYDIRTAAAWGFVGRNLEMSLRDILTYEQPRDFAIRAFQKEEAAALGLFS